MNTSIFVQRMTKFANYLSIKGAHPKQGKLTQVGIYLFVANYYRMEITVNIASWVTEELAYIFPEHWHYNKERKEYTLIGDIPDTATAEAGIGAFFNMSEKEFLHCFSLGGKLPGYHYPKEYGGIRLKQHHGPAEIAQNLKDLAAHRLSQIFLN